MEVLFLLPLFSASATKPSTFTKLSAPWQGTDRGLGGSRMKQFGQGLHTKQLQGNEVSQLYPIQLQAAAKGTVSASQSPLSAPSPLGQLQPPHQQGWIGAGHQSSPKQPSLSPLPSLQTLSSVRSASTCGCNMLVGALEVAGCYLSAVQLWVGQMQSAPFVALSSSVRLNQLRKGVFRSLCRGTEACQKKGEDGGEEKVRQ